MKSAVVIRLLVGAFALAVFGWLVWHTRWEEVEVDDPAHGLAASDEFYALRRVLEGAGATLEVRTALEPMPPADATLLLESGLWDIFPERDAHLQAWVENGGHLVVLGQFARGDLLRWVPLAVPAPRRQRGALARKRAEPPTPAASAADDDADDDTDDPPVVGRRLPLADEPGKRWNRIFDPKHPWRECADFTETDATPAPAYEPGRVYRGCTLAGVIRPLNHAVPSWQLSGPRGTLATRVEIGRGNVTAVSPSLVIDNRGVLNGDNGLIAGAVLQAVPGRAVWIVRDEAREPLIGWLWHEARTPTLLALAAIALALWRLMVRFGPREAVPPRARRSMGEQVRGTGQFIAGSDPRALHAATRQAFDAVARRRVEGWAELDDAERISALAATLQPAHALDRAALQASMNIGGGATPPQILAAIAVLEHARRALLRVNAS